MLVQSAEPSTPTVEGQNPDDHMMAKKKKSKRVELSTEKEVGGARKKNKKKQLELLNNLPREQTIELQDHPVQQNCRRCSVSPPVCAEKASSDFSSAVINNNITMNNGEAGIGLSDNILRCIAVAFAGLWFTFWLWRTFFAQTTTPEPQRETDPPEPTPEMEEGDDTEFGVGQDWLASIYAAKEILELIPFFRSWAR